MKYKVWTFCLTASLICATLCFSQEKEEEMAKVLIKTNVGEIKVELYGDKAPITVKNFLTYVKDDHYKGTIFHRVIDGFMIQGGGFTEDFTEKPTHPPIKNEAENGLKNKRGTLAMARTSDVNSASAQFFINVVDNAFLDFRGKSPQEYGYCVFGKVIEGMDVVDKIVKTPTHTVGFYQDVPVKAIVIEEVVEIASSPAQT